MRNKFCISSTASFQKINHAITNRSITKQTFSFSKSNRFDQSKPICPKGTYGGDFVAKKGSSTGIGFGHRSDFTRCLTVSPSSNQYNLKTFWDENISKNKGSGFGLSRDKVRFSNYIPKQALEGPTSTQYNNDKPYKIAAPKYTLRQKTNVIDKTMTISAQNKNPGPGSYLNPQLQSKPSFKLISKFQNISFGQARSKRFAPSQTLTPGPGKYKEINALATRGNYVLSQSKGGTKAKFDTEKRQSLFEQVYKKQLKKVGPGYYQTPSQFGQYDGDIYTEFRQTQKSSKGFGQLSERKTFK